MQYLACVLCPSMEGTNQRLTQAGCHLSRTLLGFISKRLRGETWVSMAACQVSVRIHIVSAKCFHLVYLGT